MKSHTWEIANFDIDCADSIQSKDGYYWLIYDSPDQFDTILCVSMNKDTYKKLQQVMRRMRQSNYAYSKYIERELDKFHLLYGQCEESVLIYE